MEPAPLTGLIYRGAWDPEFNSPEITDNSFEKAGNLVDASSGDYFIVTKSFSTSDEIYNKGDWLVFNGIEWEKIDNTGAVLSVFNRKGPWCR